MIKFWRKNRIKIVVFLDDGLGMNSELLKTIKDSNFVKQSLLKAGFVINEEKSIWDPQFALEWTGLWWNGKDFSICIPDRRINSLKEEMNHISDFLPFVSARSLARLVGKIISLMPVVGNVSRLMTRYLYLIIQSRKSWDSLINIKDQQKAIDEIFFWKNSVDNLIYVS